MAHRIPEYGGCEKWGNLLLLGKTTELIEHVEGCPQCTQHVNKLFEAYKSGLLFNMNMPEGIEDVQEFLSTFHLRGRSNLDQMTAEWIEAEARIKETFFTGDNIKLLADFFYQVTWIIRMGTEEQPFSKEDQTAVFDSNAKIEQLYTTIRELLGENLFVDIVTGATESSAEELIDEILRGWRLIVEYIIAQNDH